MKERLKRFRRLLLEIEIEEHRRKVLTEIDGYASDKSKETIDSRLRRMWREEERERRELSEIIEMLPLPEQRQVLFARYFDGHAWCGVAQLLFGRRPDYWTKQDSYERRVYRIHGEALANANRIAQTTPGRRPKRRFVRVSVSRTGKHRTSKK